MPVYLDRDFPSRQPSIDSVDVGLVNNMPDWLLSATEQQFIRLLDAAAGGTVVRMWLYALPDVPRGESGRRHISSFYSDIESLWDCHLDGLIVTGTEPRALKLTDEPYWASMTRLLEWGEQNTHSTVWSCLAAHAAVLHSDGIQCRRLPERRFGLFECARVSDHPLTAGVPARLVMPHSRWNDLSESELTAGGYSVLTRSDSAGVDAFIKERTSLFVFFQGHPEYDTDTLMLEYTTDVGRYLRRENDTFPPLPRRYFDPETAVRLAALGKQALDDRRPELIADFQAAMARGSLSNPWRSAATPIYRNWIEYLCARKDQRLKQRKKFEAGRESASKRRFTAG